jgi:glycine cleavage system aminomethyltransferase T
LDLSNDRFPYMSAAEVHLSDIPTRLFRLSFSGELAYEIAVPATYGDSLIRAIMAAGRPWDIVPYGLEALGAMALEKGHLSGNELNGRTTMEDLGFARLVSEKKDCIGKTLARRSALTAPDRRVLVGLKSKSGTPFNTGALLLTGDENEGSADDGYVTSAGFSPTLGTWIGMGLLSKGRIRIGEHVRAYDPVRNSDSPVEVCDTCFYDPKAERLRV